MNRNFIIAILLTSAAVGANAQDSIRNRFSELFQQKYDFYLRRAITQPLLPIQQYAVIGATYNYAEGSFIARQDAPKQNELSFATEGTKKINKYLLSGSFSYIRTIADSMAYTLGNNKQAAPFYFYAGAKGNWELSHYNLQGIISRPVFNDKLIVSAGANYHTGNAWRSNDPRVEDFSHEMGLEGAILYKINAQHTIGGSFAYSRLSEENGNEYRNKDYQGNLLNMPYINVINYGYGLSVIQTTSRQINSNNNGVGLSGLYHGSFDFGTISISAGIKDVHSKFVQKATEFSSANYLYGKFNENIWTSDFLWKSHQNETQNWSVYASYKDHYGKDFNTVLNGNNFVYYNTEFLLTPAYAHLKNKQLQYELGLSGRVSRLYKADGSTDHIANYKNAELGLIAAYYFSGKKPNNFLKISAGAHVRKNIDAQVSAPQSQVNTFTKEVVYYDYYFNGANSNSFTFSALYNFSVKKMPFFIKSTYQFQNAKLPEFSLPATALPGTERHFGSFGLGFTL
ncbi:MAG: hypothetical protein JSS98_10805 [Bacteroidetes bacterium]|nr:hypothetical protein [Bacteroidota bacterium]